MSRFQIRRGTSQHWKEENPILLPGEFGLEVDTGKLKIGQYDNQRWEDIPYIGRGREPIKVSEIENLLGMLEEKANIEHEHSIADIENLDTYLSGKSDEGHTHELIEVNDRFGRCLTTTVAGNFDLDLSHYERFYLTITNKVTLSVSNVPHYPATYKMRLKLTSSESGIIWPPLFSFTNAKPPIWDTTMSTIKWVILEVINSDRIEVFVQPETFF